MGGFLLIGLLVLAGLGAGCGGEEPQEQARAQGDREDSPAAVDTTAAGDVLGMPMASDPGDTTFDRLLEGASEVSLRMQTLIAGLEEREERLDQREKELDRRENDLTRSVDALDDREEQIESERTWSWIILVVGILLAGFGIVWARRGGGDDSGPPRDRERRDETFAAPPPPPPPPEAGGKGKKPAAAKPRRPEPGAGDTGKGEPRKPEPPPGPPRP